MKKNVSGQKIGAQMVSASDGSAFTGSVTVYVTGDAGTQAAGSVGSGACTHEGNGYHTYAPAQAETNYDLIAFTFVGTGAVPQTVQVFTGFPQTVDNATNITAIKAKTDNLPAAPASTTNITAATGIVLSGVTHTGAVIPTVSTLTGHTAQTGDSFARIGATGSGLTSLASAANLTTVAGYIDTEVAAIKAVTDALPDAGALTSLATAAALATVDTVVDSILVDTAEIGAAGAGLTALASASLLSTVAGYLDTEIAAIKAVTDALPDAGALTSIATAAALATVDGVVDAILVDTAEIGAAGAGLTALASASNLSTLTGYVDTEVAAIKAKTDNLPASPAAVSDIPTAADVADAVWDEAIAGHAGSGSTGEALAAAGASGDPWITALPGSYTAGQAGYIVGTNLDAAVSSVGGGSSDWDADERTAIRSILGIPASGTTPDDPSAGILDTIRDGVVGVKTVTDALPDSGALTSLATAAALATVDGNVDAILVDTAEIGTAGAGLTVLATQSLLTTVAGYLDTEVAAIKAKTDNLPASPAAVSDIPTAGAIADAVLDEALSGHTTSGTAGKALIDTDLRGSRTVIRGTVDTGASATSIPTSAFSPAGASADQFKGRIVVFDNDTTTAALRGEATDITASSNATNPTLTVTALSATPASGDTFSVL